MTISYYNKTVIVNFLTKCPKNNKWFPKSDNAVESVDFIKHKL